MTRRCRIAVSKVRQTTRRLMQMQAQGMQNPVPRHNRANPPKTRYRRPSNGGLPNGLNNTVKRLKNPPIWDVKR
ncbi:hypothetical protein JCM17960_25180 [Magnetospira thiophila]